MICPAARVFGILLGGEQLRRCVVIPAGIVRPASARFQHQPHED
jgi:hypothetical protein